MQYIEDYLEHYVDKIGVTDNNKQILESINRQCKKGTALTDRQYELVKRLMLEKHIEDFTGVEPTRLPLRQIDRSKYIKIVTTADVMEGSVYESYKADWKWIEVRFPFAKKTIIDIDKIAHSHRKNYKHNKGSHKHHFKLSETVIVDLVSTFGKKEFEIDPQILNWYEQATTVKENPSDYIPGFWANELINFDDKTIKKIKQIVPDLDPVKLYDRKRQLGISYITTDLPGGLVGDICKRPFTHINVDPNSYSLDKIISSLMELDRFPLLVPLDTDNELDQATKIYNSLKNLIPNDKQVALCRVSGSAEYNFNDFVKENGLNNWLDNNTKVVYINKNKLPKLLLKESWKPQAVVTLSSIRFATTVDTYISSICDLVIAHDAHKSYFWRDSSAYL